jgi:hypothetical protein
MAATHRQRKLARKRRGGALPQRRFYGAGRHVTEVESETLLTARERRRIKIILHEYRVEGRDIPLQLMDFRHWEIKRKTGWSPYWTDKRWGNVYRWWISLDPHDRQELAELSRGAGMRDNDM